MKHKTLDELINSYTPKLTPSRLEEEMGRYKTKNGYSQVGIYPDGRYITQFPCSKMSADGRYQAVVMVRG